MACRSAPMKGAKRPFVLDVTAAIQPGQQNRLAVRVLNPTHEPIDGIVLNQTARRCKVIPYSAGAAFNHGGIVDSVELLVVPAVYVEDRASDLIPKTGVMQSQVVVHNHDLTACRGTIVAQRCAGRQRRDTADSRSRRAHSLLALHGRRGPAATG